MKKHNLALLGFGNVGRALARLLLRKRETLAADYGITFAFTGIATGSKGRAVDPSGLDIEQALALVEAGEPLDSLSRSPIADNFDFIARSEAQVLFENTPVNYATGQPAVDHLRAALQMGMHAITANKGPVVHALDELEALAAASGVRFFYEGTVMDGAPIFSLFRGALPAVEVKAIKGVLNSTTNLMLDRMEAGDTFEQAVAAAQAIGVAETDPSGDIDGWDAAIKIAALASVLMRSRLTPADVDREGIRGIGPDEIARAKAAGKRWKLVCTAEREGDGVRARVAPELVGVGSPMYGVTGTTSIIQFETDVLGRLSIVEEDPGVETTAYGLLADFINAVK
ncbi:MAG TPA: homoserine dehydrogenase [Anaerolineales bacterium]|nr:homoserine dehydrogenase [Anaerolineales bacterium]